MIFPYFELAASLFILLFAFSIYSRHYENPTARFFARFALLAFFASILEYSLRIAFTLELAGILNRFSASLWSFVFPVFTHFCLIFSQKDSFLKKWFSLPILYFPAALLSVLFLFTNFMYVRHDIYHFGIANQPAPLYWLFALNTIIYVSWGIILLVNQYLSNPQIIERSQAALIAVGSILAGIVGIFTDEILPLVQGYRLFPPTCVFDIAIMIFFIYLAMRRYALFAISPALAADIIIETMPDSMVMTDLEGRVILVNEEAHKYFRAPKEKIVGSPIEELFLDKEKYNSLYERIVFKNKEILRYAADLVDPLGETIPSLINANKVRDALGASMGVVYIIRDIRG